MRSRALRPVALLVIVALVLLGLGSPGYAASANAAPVGAPIQAAAVRYDGETIFRGLAFGQGPVARLFPELASAPALSPEQAAAVDAIVAQMRAFDPGFFDRFAAAMYGSRVRVRAALESANELGKRSILAINARYSSAAASSEQGQCLVFPLVVVAVLAVAGAVVVVAAGAVALVAAGAVAVVLWVWLWFWWANTPAEAEQASLARDIWSDNIVRTMRAPVASIAR